MKMFNKEKQAPSEVKEKVFSEVKEKVFTDLCQEFYHFKI
jgi:hypothetical protein